MKKIMSIYYYKTNSNAAPFVSDPDSGFIDAISALEALKKVVKNYDHPRGLYAATINSCEEKSKVLASYLSIKAYTTQKAVSDAGGSCSVLKEGGKIFINDKEVPWEKEDVWENFEAKEQKQ